MEGKMTHISDRPDLVGRDKEIERLEHLWDAVRNGKGTTVFISGEAGIGKTRLINELTSSIKTEDRRSIHGWCLAQSLEPLMPFKEGFRDAGLSYLMADDTPPKVISSYLINEGGLLITKAEREESDLDPDIFASMLSAVGNFVTDSLGMMGEEQNGRLNAIGYGEHNILIQSIGSLSLAVVIEGKSNEFLIDDMRGALEEIGERFGSWDGNMDEAEKVRPKIEWFVDSRKYGGKQLVDDPKLKQENLFENVLLGLKRLSQECPVIIFLDDLQWAEPTTLKLLHYLSRNTRDDRIMIIGTYRPEDVILKEDGITHNLKTTMQNMNREGLYSEFRLERLDRASVEGIIRSSLKEAILDEDFIDRAHHESEGNPFFLLEILNMLIEDENLVQTDGTWRVEGDVEKLQIPSKVYDVVVRRLDRLLEEQREVLECASIVGEEFESSVVGEVMGFNRIKLLKSLDKIERTHRLIRSMEKKYRFEHRKIREVLYDGVNTELREEYHRIVAESYQRLFGRDVEEYYKHIAHHFYKAKDERGVRYLLDLGDTAKDNYANEEAVRFYLNATSIASEGGELKDIYEGLGDVYTVIGEYDLSLESYERASRLVEEGYCAHLFGKMAEVLNNKGDYDTALERVERGLELCEKEDRSFGKLLNIKGWSLMLKGDYERSIDIFKEELDLVEAMGEMKGEGRALHDLGTVYIRTGEYEEAECLLRSAVEYREMCEDIKGLGDSFNSLGVIYKSKGDMDGALKYYRKSMEIEEEIGNKQGIARALNNMATIYWHKGELEEALTHYGLCLDIVERTGDKGGTALTLSNIGNIYVDKGERDTALDHYEKSLSIREDIGSKNGIAISLNNIGNVFIDMQELDKALQYHERSMEIEEEIGDSVGIAYSLNSIGLIYLYKGEPEKAILYFERSQDKSEDTGDKMISVYDHCGIAEAMLEIGDVERGRAHAQEALEIAVGIGGKFEEGMCHRVLGMVYSVQKRSVESVGEFERAIELLKEVGEKRELSRTYYEYGRAMEGEKRTELLEKALSMFKGMGLDMWIEKTIDEMSRKIL